MKTTIQSKVILFILIIVLLCSVFLSAPFSAHALVIPDNAFDNTDIADDLSDLDLTKYPKVENAAPSVLYFIEYCFSDNDFKMSNYALYLYIYNPSCTPYIEHSAVNVINMGIKYDSYSEDSKPIEYKNVRLQFLDKTDGEHENLFYKFKVLDSDGTIRKNAQAASETIGKRRYDVAGIQLYEQSTALAVDYGVSTTWWFWGFSAGYGDSQESTLDSEYKQLETVELKVHNTFYRTKTSSAGAYHQNQMDTVYFAVPKRLFNDYGTLQRIKAEWYEYKTKKFVVTENETFASAAEKYFGVDVGRHTDSLKYGLGYGFHGAAGTSIMSAVWGWNIGHHYLIPPPNVDTFLPLLFSVNNISDYDPYADISENGGVTSNVLYDRIKGYKKSFNNGTLPIKNRTISADLFEADIDEFRKKDTAQGKIQKGYSYYDFDASIDTQTLLSWQDGDPSFWDNIRGWGLWNTIFGKIPQETGKTIAPIKLLGDSDLNGSDAEISERLLIQSSAVRSLKKFYTDAVTIDSPTDEEKVVVLFRFAVSDYFSAPVSIVEIGDGIGGSEVFWHDNFIDGQAYVAQESVFFDFDIIQLGFQKGDAMTIIPVVASPIDIVNALTSPVVNPLDKQDLLKIILSVILLVLLIIVLVKIVKAIARRVNNKNTSDKG